MSRRRALVPALALGLFVAPPSAEAQQARQVHRVGFLGLTSAAAVRPLEPFRAGLLDHGYAEGGTSYRLRGDRGPGLHRARLERRPSRGKRDWPVVPGDAGAGELAPKASRVAVLRDHTFRSYAAPYQEHVQPAARLMKLTFRVAEFQGREDLDTALAGIVEARSDALWVMGAAATFVQRRRIADFAAQNRLPGLSSFKEFVEAGGLASYGASLPDLYRRAARYVDRILRGAKPADLPWASRSRNRSCCGPIR